MRWSIHILLLIVTAFAVSCSKQVTTGDLSRELESQMQALPGLVRGVDSESSADAAVEKIRALANSVVSITERVEEGAYLGHEQRVSFEGTLRDVQDETEYLLEKLSAQPELVIKLVDPIAELGDALELAARVMKQPKS